ncbi:hypothetical protein [Salinarchaeum laminariae]|uniref:hypothetical protein n=1 Tax=Salinarchaeum laminariae TaxID=869888 RepID=UPI0020BE205E|nr:hypothetical protein [Salinarchaeum laminariae]
MEWFFSTLAQASAAITGIIVAIASVLYQLEKQKSRENQEVLKEEMADFRDKYERVLAYICGQLQGPPDTHYAPGSPKVAELESTPEELKKRIIEESENADPEEYIPWTSKGYWALPVLATQVARIHWFTSKIGPTSNISDGGFTLDSKDYNKIKESIDFLSKETKYNSNMMSQLTHELTELSGFDPDESETGVAQANIFAINAPGISDNPILEWLHSDREDHRLIPERHTGRNLYSITDILIELEKDFSRVDAAWENAHTTGDFPLIKVIWTSTALLFFGVFLPIISLIEIPITVNVSQIVIFLYQLILLSVSTILTGYLVYSIFDYTEDM